MSRADQERMKINAAGEYFRKMREEFIRQQVGSLNSFYSSSFFSLSKNGVFVNLQFQRLRIQFKKSFITSPEKYFCIHVLQLKKG